MKMQSVLRQSFTLGVVLSCLIPPVPLSHRADAQDVIDAIGHPKLGGQSRRLTGQTRALGSSSSSTKLPRTIMLGFAAGEIKIEASTEKVTSPDAISFSTILQRRKLAGRQMAKRTWQVLRVLSVAMHQRAKSSRLRPPRSASISCSGSRCFEENRF